MNFLEIKIIIILKKFIKITVIQTIIKIYLSVYYVKKYNISFEFYILIIHSLNHIKKIWKCFFILVYLHELYIY